MSSDVRRPIGNLWVQDFLHGQHREIVRRAGLPEPPVGTRTFGVWGTQSLLSGLTRYAGSREYRLVVEAAATAVLARYLSEEVLSLAEQATFRRTGLVIEDGHYSDFWQNLDAWRSLDPACRPLAATIRDVLGADLRGPGCDLRRLKERLRRDFGLDRPLWRLLLEYGDDLLRPAFESQPRLRPLSVVRLLTL